MIWRPTTLVIAAGAIFWKVDAWGGEREGGEVVSKEEEREV